MGRLANLWEDIGTTLKNLVFGDPPGDGGEEEVRVVLKGASAEDILDLLVLLRLRHEGTLPCTLDDIALWTDLRSEDVQHLHHTGLWAHLWEQCSFTLNERRTMYAATLYLLTFNREGHIGATVRKLVAAALVKEERVGSDALGGEDDDEDDTTAAEKAGRDAKVRKAITDRFYYSMVVQSRIVPDKTAD